MEHWKCTVVHSSHSAISSTRLAAGLLLIILRALADLSRPWL